MSDFFSGVDIESEMKKKFGTVPLINLSKKPALFVTVHKTYDPGLLWPLEREYIKMFFFFSKVDLRDLQHVI